MVDDGTTKLNREAANANAILNYMTMIVQNMMTTETIAAMAAADPDVVLKFNALLRAIDVLQPEVMCWAMFEKTLSQMTGTRPEVN
jgi:hypothetical protein